jgi:uncharacterized membrane-anchored protein
MDKNNKKIIVNEEENIFNDLDNENYEYEKEIEDEYENLEYFENTIDIIHKELIYYIENKSITVGEYLKKDKLNMFLSL